MLTGVLYATAVPSVNGQAATHPDVAARRLSTQESAELRIDGLLDERAWEAAASATCGHCSCGTSDRFEILDCRS